MHEHVVTDYTPPSQRDLEAAKITLENHFELSYHWVSHPGMRDLSDPDVATREMQFMIDSGGRSVVDVSTRGMMLYPKGHAGSLRTQRRTPHHGLWALLR